MRLKLEKVKFFLCLIILSDLIEAKRDYKIILKKCDLNIKRPQILQYVNCSIKAEPNNSERNTLNGIFIMNQNVTNFEFRVNFDLLRKDNTKINLINQQFDGCKFLEANYGHNILKTVLQGLRRASSFPKKCPVLSGVRYEIREFAVNEDDYPPFIPALTFVVVVKFYLEKVHEADLVMTGNVKKV